MTMHARDMSGDVDPDWWRDHFDAEYEATWELLRADELIDGECDTIGRLLGERGIGPGGRLLDSPCGGGRHAVGMARRGYVVTGCDLSLPSLRAAQERAFAAADGIDTVGGSIAFDQRDMRRPAALGHFDAATCWYTSLGYTLDVADDIAALRALRTSVRPGGIVLVETDHRASVEASWVDGGELELGGVLLIGRDRSFHDGILTETRASARNGVETAWTLQLRIHALDELVDLAEQAGLRVTDVLAGPDGTGPATRETRAIIVAERP